MLVVAVVAALAAVSPAPTATPWEAATLRSFRATPFGAHVTGFFSKVAVAEHTFVVSDETGAVVFDALGAEPVALDAPGVRDVAISPRGTVVAFTRIIPKTGVSRLERVSLATGMRDGVTIDQTLLASGTTLAVDDDGGVVLASPQGGLVWNTTAPHALTLSCLSARARIDGVVCVDDDGGVISLDREGHERWRQAIARPFRFASVSMDNDAIAVLRDDETGSSVTVVNTVGTPGSIRWQRSLASVDSLRFSRGGVVALAEDSSAILDAQTGVVRSGFRALRARIVLIIQTLGGTPRV
jgi:hypothetical protein